MEDTIRLKSDILTMASVSNIDVDDVKLNLLLEDILSNYKVERKTVTNSQNDIIEKVEMYLIGKRLEGISDITIKNYTYELLRFSDFINKACSQITTVDIRSYLASYKNIKPSTLSTKVTILRSFFGWLHQEEIILKNPTLKIKTPKIERRILDTLSIRELEIVRESCKTLRESALVNVGYSTACRVSELINIKIEDINFNNMSVNVIGKGNKERTVFISEKAMYHLEKYLESRKDDCEYLFVTVRAPVRQMSVRAMQRELGIIMDRANIDKTITMHGLRRSHSQLAISNGIDISDLSGILGHSSPSVTLQNYGALSIKRKQQAFNRYHVQ